VQVGDQHPQETQQPEDQQGIVDPQAAAHISQHANACSYEHPFWCKAHGRHKGVTIRRARRLAVAIGLMLLVSSCLADPQHGQSVDLLDGLSTARGVLSQQPARLEEACNAVGDVQTRLYGEPGLVNVQPAWSQLRHAADALNAVCGQATLLDQPAAESAAIRAAHQRWESGIQREMAVACDHLRAAAAALNRDAPC
jgi:hypothetical protein